MEGSLKMESLMIPVDSTDSLHLKRIYINPEGPPIFMLHGSAENDRMFYSISGGSGYPRKLFAKIPLLITYVIFFSLLTRKFMLLGIVKFFGKGREHGRSR